MIEEIAGAGGGQVIENLDNAFSSENLPARYDRQDLFYLLLTMALLLFMVDVAVRRFRINFAFVTKLSSGFRGQRSKGNKTTEKRSTQLSQLKQASTKKAVSKSKQTKPIIEKQPDQAKKRSPKEKTARPKSDKKSKSGQTSGGEGGEEKMARLLNAKKRGPK